MTMTDLERELRDAMSAAVADAEPRGDVMELVRQRHRQRSRRMLAVGAIVFAVIAAAVPSIGHVRRGPPTHEPAPRVRLFPGGGRILLESHGDLRWLYPDGRTVTIASGFAGASLAGTKLLAWKNVNPPGASRFLPKNCFSSDCARFYGVSYYTMNLDGTNAKLVLAAERPFGNTAIYHGEVQPSPDGSRLAYLRVEQRRNGTVVTTELWSMSLMTGRKTDLGSYSSPFAWRDNGTILISTSRGRSVQLVNAIDGSKSTYLTIRNPRLIHAYERASPGQGAPASLWPDSLNSGPSSAALALSVTGRNANSPPAQALVEHDRVLAFAPGRISALWLMWGHDGVFLLHALEGHDPGNWSTYAGTTYSPHLSRAETFGDQWDRAVFNPRGNVIAFFYSNGGAIGFAPVTSPACHETGECLHFQPKPLFGRGRLMAWAP